MPVRILYIAVLALTIFLPIRGAEAVEPLSITELASHCERYPEDANSKDAVFCVRYVQGFIDGAVATDERVAENVAAEYERKETYSERAIRTRSPSRSLARLDRYGATVYADFCLGAPVALREVVEHVVQDLMNRKVLDEQLLARDAVYAVLRRDYPCEKDDDE